MSTDFRALCAELTDRLQHAITSVNADSYYGENRDAVDRARAELAKPEGPPKNCWLDDEPDLCPSPCVFDDPSEVISNCVEARYLSEKGKPKEACKYYRTTAQPEPVGPSDEELLEAFDGEFAEFFDSSDGFGTTAIPRSEWTKVARAVLARWGTPANTTNQEDYE